MSVGGVTNIQDRQRGSGKGGGGGFAGRSEGKDASLG